jgi:phosphatidylinositol glycan class A protein
MCTTGHFAHIFLHQFPHFQMLFHNLNYSYLVVYTCINCILLKFPFLDSMVSDFFYPNMGGVESHIYQLSQCLMERGHKVIIITHLWESQWHQIAHNWMLLETFHVALFPSRSTICPYILSTISASCALFFQIFLLFVSFYYVKKSRLYMDTRWVDLKPQMLNCSFTHAPLTPVLQSFSALAHEAMFHARTMGIRAVFTDHSLFGFANASSIVTNKILKYSLSGTNHVICVSHTRSVLNILFNLILVFNFSVLRSKENTVLRAGCSPHAVSVIPNAIDSTVFTPDLSKRHSSRCECFTSTRISNVSYLWEFFSCLCRSVRVIVMCRLVYRKGADLLAAIIPQICKQHPNVDFIIGEILHL